MLHFKVDIRLRTDGVAEVHQFSPALEGHPPQLAPHRRGAAVGGPMLRAHQDAPTRAPRSVCAWVTVFDGENLRDGCIGEAGPSGVETFKKAPAVAFLRSLTRCA